MGERITASKTNLMAIRKSIKKEPCFVENYCRAAPGFRKVDDGEWSTGKVCFSWSLRPEVVERVLNNGYRQKGVDRSPLKKKSVYERTLENLGVTDDGSV